MDGKTTSDQQHPDIDHLFQLAQVPIDKKLSSTSILFLGRHEVIPTCYDSTFCLASQQTMAQMEIY